mgnify:CR=1 FL=1
MESISFQVNGLGDLDAAALMISNFAKGAHFFIFEGEMGAGKTTLIKALAQAMGVTEVVSSPTFSIVNEYNANGQAIYHFDFYRIKNLQEAYDIGYEEYFYSGNTCFIEWPEKVAELIPDHFVQIKIETLDEHSRLLSISKF